MSDDKKKRDVVAERLERRATPKQAKKKASRDRVAERLTAREQRGITQREKEDKKSS